LLFARLLIATVEGIAQQLWMSREHHVVERVRDDLDVFANYRERGFNDFFVRR
jgi:hypothetical protein